MTAGNLGPFQTAVGARGTAVMVFKEHSLACPTSCHPHELKSAKFWGTCAGPMCGK